MLPTRAPIPLRPAAILALASVAQLMLVVDDTIVNVALPTVGEELGFSEASLSWVVNAYFLTFGGFLLIGGRIADRIGPRRAFAAALAAFALASAVCGAAWDDTVLVLARGVQGIAAALLSPAALALILGSHPEGPERARALAVWTSLLGVGAATGLLAGGALTELLDWRWVFFVNLPIAATALLLVRRMVPADGDRDVRTSPNVTGATLGTLALLVFVFTVVETEHQGWGSARTLVGFAVAALLVAVFAAGERRSASPLLPPSLLRRRRPMVANGSVFLGAAGLMAMFFFQTLYLQRVLGWGPLETGAAFLPFSLSMGIVSAAMGRVVGRVDVRLLVGGGMGAAAGGLAWMASLTPDSSYVGHVAPSLALTAAGLGAAFMPLMEIATGGAEDRDGGLASALLTTGQQIGGAIGIAAMVTIATTTTRDELAAGTVPAQALTDGFTHAFRIQAIVLLVAGAIAVALLGRVRERRAARVEGDAAAVA